MFNAESTKRKIMLNRESKLSYEKSDWQACALLQTNANDDYSSVWNGADKDYEQIADLPNSYILADDMEFPYGHKLPLWIIGFLY